MSRVREGESTIWEQLRRRRMIQMAALLSLALIAGLAMLSQLAPQAAAALRPRPTQTALLLPSETPTGTPTSTPSPSATATPTASPTATVAPQPTATPSNTPTPPPACTELLRDGGFETGDAWAIVSTAYVAGYVSRPASYVTEPVHSGQRALRLGISEGPDLFSYSAAEQWVTIPAEVAAARLSLWLHLVTAARADDAQFVLILKEKGGYDVLMQVLANNTGWQRVEFSLDAYRGQRIAIHFEVRNNGDGRLTAMYVDDVSLVLCPRLTPTPYPTATR